MSTENNVTILDTETGGKDKTTAEVIEVGVILYSLDHFTALESYSVLLRCAGQPAESERINGIPSAALPFGRDAAEAWAIVRRGFLERSKAVLAHGAEFDKGFTPPELRALRPWICTNEDISWPLEGGSRALVALTLAHGLGVEAAHRALCDCNMIARLLTRCHEMGHDVKAMLRRGLRPKAKFQALVSFDDKDKAKEAGFRWLPDERNPGGKNIWVRTMAVEDAATLPFRTVMISPPSAAPLALPTVAS